MVGGTRRTHKKSRNGCSQCKRRRKKCDERPPQCSNCRKWGVVCEYSSLGPATPISLPSTSPSQIQAVISPDSYYVDFPLPLPTLTFRDLELMHQYSTRTFRTLSRKEFWDIWQVKIPEEAQSHQFLMHSILALSALHISHRRKSEREPYARMARSHHERALTSFRCSVADITPENGTAITAFSLLNVLFSTGLSAVFDFPDPSDPIGAFVEILALLRHGWSLFRVVRDAVENGAIGDLVRQRQFATVHELPETTKKAMDDLETTNINSNDSDGDKLIYQRAIGELRSFFSIYPVRPPNWGHIIYWPTEVSSEFFSLLQAKRPMALAMLAHWAIPLHHAPSLWYMNGWGMRVMEAIWYAMDDEWRRVIWWPAQEASIVHSTNKCADWVPKSCPIPFCSHNPNPPADPDSGELLTLAQ